MISTQIFINNRNVDLYDDEPIKLIYSLADIKNLATRNSTYSLPITLPATKDNNALFSHLYNIGSDSTTFNPNLKTDVLVNVDTINVIDGTFQLLEVNVDKDQQISSYKGVVYSNTFDFYKTISNRSLRDLSLTADTRKNNNNYVNSIVPSADPIIAYPLVDRNYGWSYSTITGYTSIDMISVEELKPCMYYKALLDNIISNAGYTYSSNFLNSTYFKELIIDFNSNEYLNVDYSFTIDVGMNGAYFTTIPANVYLVRRSNITNVEENIAEYTFDGNDIIGTYTGAYYVGSNNTYERLRKTISGSTSYQQGDVIGLKIYRPAPFAQGSDFYDYNIFYSSLKLTYKNAINSDIEVESVGPSGYTINTYLNEFVNMPVIITNPGSSWYTNYHITPAIDFNYLLPDNIKQGDLLQWGVNLFNLYIDIDKSDVKKLIIEPRDDYYANNNIVRDWSNKLDVLKDISIKVVSELQDKEYKFTYKEDDDIKNSEYKIKYVDHIYGDETIEFENEFLTNKKKIETGFAPTPMEYIVGSSILVPKIYKNGTAVNDKIEYKPRLFINLGFSAVTALQNNEQYVINWGTSSGGIVPYSYRGFAGDINHPYNPTYSILYGDPKEIYYNPPFQYPSDNLYQRFWEKNIKELGDKNSKLVTAYFNLKPADISTLKFSDLIFVDGLDGQYFRLYKVEYDALANTTTKVTLLLVTEQVNNLKNATIIKTRLSSVSTNGIKSGKGNVFGNQSLVVGRFNNVGIENSNIFVSGDENRVLPFSRYINIIGSINSVDGGNTNISILNSDNNTITSDNNTAYTQNNVTIINGGNNIVSSSGTNVTFIGVQNFTGQTISDTVYVSNLVVLGSISGVSDLYWVDEGGSGSIKTKWDNPNHFIDSSTYSLVGGGTSNTLTGSTNSIILGGLFNLTTDSDYSAQMGGRYNTIRSSTDSLTLGGYLNSVIGDKNIAIGGTSNIIKGSDNRILGGDSNTIEDGSNSSIVGSAGVTINGSLIGIYSSNEILITDTGTTNDNTTVVGSHTSLLSGFQHKLFGAINSNISEGNNSGFLLVNDSNIGNSSYSYIIGSMNGTISDSIYSIIVGGDLNNIIQNYSLGSAILNGTDHLIDNATDGTIVGGGTNQIKSLAYYCSIFGGTSNTVQYSSATSNIFGGIGNGIDNSSNSNIIGGGYSNIWDSSYSNVIGIGYITNCVKSSIFGGESNSVENATNCDLYGGYNNSIWNSSHKSSIFGGDHNVINNSSENSSILGGGYNLIDGATDGMIINSVNTTIPSGLTDNTLCLGTQYFTAPRGNTTYIGNVQHNNSYHTPASKRLSGGTTSALTINDHYVIVDTTAGDFTCILPPSPADGMNLRFKIGLTGGYKLTVVQNSSETIDGSTSIDLTKDYSSVQLIYDINTDDWGMVSACQYP